MKEPPEEMVTSYQEISQRYHEDQERRRWYILELTRIDDPRVPDLIVDALNHYDPLLRHWAATGLLARKNIIPKERWEEEVTRYLPILINLVKAGNEKIPGEIGEGYPCGACLALKNLGGISVIDTLIQAMASQNPVMREGGRVSLASLLIDDMSALPFIEQALKSQEVFIRLGATLVLSHFPSMSRLSIFNQLIEGLQFPEFQIAFIKSLGELGDVRAASAIIPLLNDDTSIYTGRIHGDWPLQIKHVTQEALRKMGGDVIPVLLEALVHEDVEIRTMIVYTLRRIASPAATQVVQKLLNHPDTTIRSAAQKVTSNAMPDWWLNQVYPVS